MKRLRKKYILTLLVIFALALTACSSKNKPDNSGAISSDSSSQTDGSDENSSWADKDGEDSSENDGEELPVREYISTDTGYVECQLFLSNDFFNNDENANPISKGHKGIITSLLIDLSTLPDFETGERLKVDKNDTVTENDKTYFKVSDIRFTNLQSIKNSFYSIYSKALDFPEDIWLERSGVLYCAVQPTEEDTSSFCYSFEIDDRSWSQEDEYIAVRINKLCIDADYPRDYFSDCLDPEIEKIIDKAEIEAIDPYILAEKQSLFHSSVIAVKEENGRRLADITPAVLSLK